MPISDAHDRQPKPTVKPIRLPRGRGGSTWQAEHQTPSQVRSKRRAAAKIAPRKKSGSAVGMFLKTAAGIIGHEAVEKVKDLPLTPPGVGRMLSMGAKVKDIPEITGVNAVRRIRKDKGTPLDWLTVGTMALPFAGASVRSGIRAARKPAFRITDEMASRIINKGRAQMRAKQPLRVPEGATDPMYEAISPQIAEMISPLRPYKGRVAPMPRGWRVEKQIERQTMDRGYPNRSPIVTTKNKGDTFAGPLDWSHGQLLENMNELGANVGWDDILQSHLFQPTDDIIQLELGWGDFVGEHAPVRTKGIHDLIMTLLRDYTDDEIMGIPRRMYSPTSRGNYTMLEDMGKLNSPLSTNDKALEQWVKDMELPAHRLRGAAWDDAYSSFARSEKMRKRKRRSR